jgi:hypothetical protein
MNKMKTHSSHNSKYEENTSIKRNSSNKAIELDWNKIKEYYPLFTMGKLLVEKQITSKTI